MKTADIFVKALENEGVRFIFALPGEENLDVMEALRLSSIQVIICRHEQAAGFLAATYGRLTGKAGVCLSTLGPGATNFVTAAAQAELGGMPMVMITGQKPIKKSKQGQFQIVDIVNMMKPITKCTTRMINGGQAPAVVREAFRLAEEERPGATHIELPEDVAGELIDDETQVFTIQSVRRPIAEEKAIVRAVDMIIKAKRPLLLLGAGANRKLVAKMATGFVNATGIPFFNTQMGKGVIDERHRLYLGCAALSQNDFLHAAIDRADLIINLGHDAIEKPPFIMHAGDDRQVIHVNFYSAQVDEIYFPQLEVIGDIANALWQMVKTLHCNISTQWDFQFFNKIKTEIENHIIRDEKSNRFPLIPQRIVHDVRAVMPEDGILSLDNGMYKIWFARNYKAYQPNTLLLDNALATMGAGLPGAMAAKLVYPDRKVVAICGDGGFMINSQELETAMRLRLNLVIVILNDSGYGMIRWKQEGMGLESFGLSFGNPDFVKYAQAYGAEGYRVEKTEGFARLLSECLEKKGLHLIDVPIDYSENDRVLTRELKEKSGLLSDL